jgi:hypothetical protein
MNKYLHVIRSSDRTSGVSENFVYTFDSAMTFIHHIRLHNLTIPNALYNIPSTANKLWTRLDMNDGGGYSGWVGFTVTPGAYTTTTLAAAMESQLDSLWSGASWTVSFDATTFKTTISNDQEFLLDIDTTAGNFPNSMHTILGYTSTVTPSDSVTSEGAYCLSLPYTFHVVIKDQDADVLTNFASKSGKVRPSFTVPINVNTGELVQVSGQPLTIQLLAPRTISSITVQLKNADDSVVDLLDLEWEMTLEFDQSIV